MCYSYFQVKKRNILLETLIVKKVQLYFLPLKRKDESLNIDASQNCDEMSILRYHFSSLSSFCADVLH